MPISAKTLDFLFENRLQNSKAWYDEHHDDYVEYVRRPLEDLVIALTPAIMEIDDHMICEPKVNKSISRVRRDTRFSKDKSLYRDTAWVSFMRDKKLYHGLPGFFFEFSPRGFRYGCGYYMASPDSMDMFRTLIINGDKSFTAALEAYENQDVFGFEGELYKKNRYPDKSEQLQNWLNRKNVDFIHNSVDFDLLFSENLYKTLSEDFMLLKPIYDFLIKVENSL